PGGASRAPRAAPGAPRGPRAPRAGPRVPRAAPGRRPSPPPAARSAPALRRTSGGSPLLRGAGELAKHAWIACFAYRRWRYEVEHPRTPRQSVPVGDAVDMVNECLNPLSFFFG
ncbi:MAG: hypothetical protein QOD13_2628, partial [Thermoleophilaceae bacterium]|nr:hypothetical protein [Thermoleophilaceae bacterium]